MADSRTTDDVFERFGGPASFARAFRIRPSTASEMKRRRSISVDLWPEVVEAASGRGIDWLTYETLTKMHAKPDRIARLDGSHV
ncbi:hypothetical protein HL667_33625 [Bradyrhizobium sp. 83012]|uniref:Uncharacterized protein n=1 Tax=Bradyrhizobium aeschynomenes TaxID=2734909 RepID=A0ABX2CRR9_9BRAD|nr:hypothetical protein [Bradyrhizobium aeschynomenes]NPU69972.1 hypothetical protein [Bradyrhizobium aeschynomenes]